MKVYILTIYAWGYDEPYEIEKVFASRERAVSYGERVKSRILKRLERYKELQKLESASSRKGSQQRLDDLLKKEFPDISHVGLFHLGDYSDGDYDIEEHDVAE
jgi:hypothetical protein